MLRSLLVVGVAALAEAQIGLTPCVSSERGNSGIASGIGSGWCCPAQSFTAAQTGPLERIDARVGSTSCQAKLRIREGLWGSTLIGESAAAQGASGGPTVFTFDPPLQLEAGKVYTIEPGSLGGTFCTWVYYESATVGGAGGMCPAGGCSPKTAEYAFTVYCSSGETQAPAIPPCAGGRSSKTVTIGSTYGVGTSSNYALKAGYPFVQEFLATGTGLPSQLGVHMGNNQNLYNCRLRILTAEGSVLLDHTYTNLKQRYSDWATIFPLVGQWAGDVQLQAGAWFKFELTTNTRVGIPPIRSAQPNFKLYNLPGYGQIATKFFLNGHECADCAAVRVLPQTGLPTDVPGVPVLGMDSVSAGSLDLSRIPNAMQSTEVHVPSLPVASESTIVLSCCDATDCMFFVSLYRCTGCASKDGGLLEALASGGWEANSCAPTFGSDAHPMITFGKVIGAGQKESFETSGTSYVAVFVAEDKSLPWCPKPQGPFVTSSGPRECSLKCA